MTEGYRLDRPTGFSCPECGGVMSSELTGTLLQFRCHIGHVLTAETMVVAQFTMVETKLAACLASLNERAELCRQMSEAAAAQGQDAASFDAARQEALERAELLKGLLESEWLATGPDYVRNLKGWSVPK
jgi:chorismate mutase